MQSKSLGVRSALIEQPRARSASAQRGQARKFDLLLAANRQLAPGSSRETLLERIPFAATALLDASSSLLWLVRDSILPAPLAQSEPGLSDSNDVARLEQVFAEVVATAKPVLELERLSESGRARSVRSWLGLPLLGGERLEGVLIVIGRPGQRFSPIDLELGEVFAGQAATAVANALLYSEASRRREQAEAMTAIAKATTSSLEFHQVLSLALEKVLEVLSLPIGIVYLWDDAADVLRVAAHQGLSEAFVAGVDRVRLGEGALGRVAASGQPELIDDVLIHPHIVRPEVRREGFRSVVIVPLQARTRVIGAMYVARREVLPFDAEHTALFVAIGQQIAVAIENARLHGASVRREEELAALLRATRTVMAGLDLQVILKQIVEVAAQITGTPYVRVLLKEACRPVTEGETAHSLSDEVWDAHSIQVAQTGRPLYVADLRAVDVGPPADPAPAAVLVTYLGLPIKGRDEILGVLVFSTTTPYQYGPDELEYLSSFADQMALAIENARLFEQVAAVEALRELARLKTEFLSTISHELRTPLTLILGYAELLMHRAPALSMNQIVDMVTEIHGGGRTMVRLVDDLLDFTRLEQGKIRFHPQRMDLAELLGRLIEPFRLQPGGERIIADLAFGLEAQVDPERFAQITNNLLTNALRYAPDGPILVSLRQQRDEALIEITDRGPGIALEEQPRVWEKFYRGGGAVLSVTRGNGLGLTVVKHLVELHGGTVGLRSTPGRGTTFWFTLAANSGRLAEPRDGAATARSPRPIGHYPTIVA